MKGEGRSEGWTGEAPPIAGIFLLLGAFYWPVLSGQAFLWGDFAERVYPLRAYAATELGQGRFPFWVGAIFGGIPVFAMIDNGVLYPLNWVLIVLARAGRLSYLALEWHTIAHVGLLGLGMYVFARGVQVSRAGSFLAAVTWMFSGPVVHHVFHPSIIQTITWLPVILLLLSKALEHASMRLAVAAAAAWGLAILAGHPQGFLYVGYAMCVLYAAFVLSESGSREGREGIPRATALFLTVLALGTALSAVALLPAYELAGLSERNGAGAGELTAYARDFRNLVLIVIPDFFGRMGPSGSDYWGPGRSDFGYFWESYIYLGIAPLLLAGLGLATVRGHMRGFLGALVALSVVGILGDVTPFPRVMQAVVPGFAQFRAHARLGLVLGFAVAVLAGMGWDRLTNREAGPAAIGARRYLVVATATSITVVTFAVLLRGPLLSWLSESVVYSGLAAQSFAVGGGRAAVLAAATLSVMWLSAEGVLGGRALSTVVCGIVLADLFSVGVGFNRSDQGQNQFFQETRLVTDLRARHAADGGRVAIERATPRILRMNAAVVHHLETPLDGLASPMRLSRTVPPAAESAVLDLMNVTHEVQRTGDGRSVTIASRPTARPRAWISRDVTVADDLTEVTALMADPAFDYRSSVVLDREPSVTVPRDPTAQPERATVTFDGTSRLTVDVMMTAPGVLVVSEVFYPAWRAWIGDREVPILRADGALRAVALEKGAQRVEMRYQSAAFRVGALITLLALLVSAGLLVGARSDPWRPTRS